MRLSGYRNSPTQRQRRATALLGLAVGVAALAASSGFGDDKPVFQGIGDRIRYRESFSHPFIDDTYGPGHWGHLARHVHHPVVHSPVAPPIIFQPGPSLNDVRIWRATDLYPPGLASDTLEHSPGEAYGG